MSYQKPTISRLGTLGELTLTKQLGWYDIVWWIPIDDQDPSGGGGGVHTGS